MEDLCHSLVYQSHTINFVNIITYPFGCRPLLQYREHPYIYVVVAVEREGGAELPSMILKRMAGHITPRFEEAR